MKPERGSDAENSTSRSALLDAAEHIMREEGYAAVSSRRLGTRAGVNPALVYYYFDNMDNLFVELFRRGADRSYERQLQALKSAQPLWALWDSIHDQSHSGATTNQQIVPALDYLKSKGTKALYLVGSDYVFPRTANKVIKAY
ncbi:TetR/AcrR family transcriptional regulator, partial [Nocardia salmonicida]|uniref:TetR/AcrR family transcriptional regulator n=1 Tax=Nocardia salmonicida TaxID=53431 RepID=UPI00365C2DEA